MLFKSKSGLTIVELIVAITLASIVILSFVPMLINIISGFSRQSLESRNVQTVTSALSVINSDAQRNYGFQDFPFLEMDDESNAGTEAGVGFTGSGEGGRILFLTLPATTRPYQDVSRKLVHNSSTTDCDTFSGDIVTYTAMYYVEEGNLYKRTVMDPDQPVCDPPHQKTSCLDGSCDQKDILLAENVTRFSVDYYMNQSDSEPIDYEELEESGLDDVTSAKVTIEVSQQGRDDVVVSYQNSVRINLVPLMQTQLDSTP